MDKPKSKDNLLAAGKKRLQEFRQKKQTKGSHGKASDKSKNYMEEATSMENSADPDQKPEPELGPGVLSMSSECNENSNSQAADSGRVHLEHTRNEENIGLATDEIRRAKDSLSGEPVKLDGSDDGTPQKISQVNEGQTDSGTRSVVLTNLPVLTNDTDSSSGISKEDSAVNAKSTPAGSSEFERNPEKSAMMESNNEIANFEADSLQETNDRSSEADAFGEGQEVNLIKEEYFKVDKSGMLADQVGPVQDIVSSDVYHQQNTGEILLQTTQVDTKGHVVMPSISDQIKCEVNLSHQSEHEKNGVLDHGSAIDVAFPSDLTTAEGKSLNNRLSREEIERGLKEEELLSEVASYKEALTQAQEENIHLTAKIRSNELLEQQNFQEKSSLKSNLEATKELHALEQRANEGLAEENANLLRELEQLKQTLGDMEGVKLEMASALEEMRIRLQSEAVEKISLSNQLDTAEQKLHEVIGERDSLRDCLQAADIEMGNVRRERLLALDDLQMSQSSLMECKNQFELELMVLQQKLQALESEKVAALSQLRHINQLVAEAESESSKETEQTEGSTYNEQYLVYEIEKFAKEAKLREEEYLANLESLRSELQLAVDEKDALLLKLDEQANERAEIENNYQEVAHGIVEMTALIDKMRKENDCLVSSKEQGELDASCVSQETEISKNGLLSTREQTEQFRVQICHLKDQLQHILQHRIKMMDELNGCNAFIENLSSEKEELVQNLQLTKDELEKIKYESGLQEKVENEKHHLIEDNNKLSLELHEHKNEIEELLRERSQLTSKMELKEQCLHGLYEELTCAQQELAVFQPPQGEENLGELCQVPVNLQASNASQNLIRDNELLIVQEKIHTSDTDLERVNVSLLEKVKHLRQCIREAASEFVHMKEDYGSAWQQLQALKATRVQFEELDGSSEQEKTASDTEIRGLQQHVTEEDSDHADKVSVLKAHLCEAEAISEKIQKVVQEMFRDPSSLSKGSRRVPARISKLIHAFEAKAQHDDGTLEAEPMTETDDSSQQSSEMADHVNNSNPKQDASFVLQRFREVEDDIGHLRTTIGQLEKDTDDIQQYITKEEQHKEYLAATLRQLEDDIRVLKQIRDEQDHIMGTLREKNAQLVSQDLEYNSQIEKLNVQLQDLKKHADQESAALHNQLEKMQQTFSEQSSLLQDERNSYVVAMLNAAKNLEESIQLVRLNPTYESDPSSVDLRLATSVNAAIEKINELRDLGVKLEFAHQESLQMQRSSEELTQKFEIIQQERDIAVRELHNIHMRLGKLVETQERMNVEDKDVVGHLQHMEAKEDERDAQSVLSVLPFDYMSNELDKFVGQLQEKLREKLQFETKTNELESALSVKNKHIEGLEGKCMELSKTCAEFEERYADMVFKEAHLSAEKDVLSSELATVQRILTEQEEAKKAISEAHTQLNLRLDSLSEKLVFVIDEGVQDEIVVTEPNMQNISYLEAQMLLLIEKYKASLKQNNLFQGCLQELLPKSYGDSRNDKMEMPLDVALKEVFSLKEMELTELREKINEVDPTRAQQEEEMKNLKDLVHKMEEDLKSVSMDRNKALFDLEQTEQKLSSVREKLSMAVSKGKGLVQQRDALKQSLAGKSDELERCWQELQIKTAALHEAEAKIKSYGEAGERVEALESELAYIRHSATSLRESFLHKDSVLQKVEEILEELNLPEEFHDKEIIEKIEWLARSCTVENAPVSRSIGQEMSEMDDKDDISFQVPNSQLDAFNLSQNEVIEDLRRKHKELQEKYLSLAEQSDMLEQSLLERNQLIQRWEETLDSVQMPVSIRSMEPEDQIEWLGRALNQAWQDVANTQNQIENAQSAADSLAIELEESQRNVLILESDLSTVKHDKELLLKNFEELTSKYEHLKEQVAQNASEKETLLKNLSDLQTIVNEQESNLKTAKTDKDGMMNRFITMIGEVLQSEDLDDISFGSSGEYLEGCLRNLIDKFKSLSEAVQMHKETNQGEPSDMVVLHSNAAELSSLQVALDAKEQELLEVSLKLEEAKSTVASYQNEQDNLVEQCRIFSEEAQALKNHRDALQIRLDESEQKLSTTKDKLSIAVKKGKGVVQQRDGLKQTLDEKVAELEQLKKDLQVRETAINECEIKIRDLSSVLDHAKILESEVSSSRSRIADLEQSLHESQIMLQRVMTALDDIDASHGSQFRDPVKEIEWLIKALQEQEAKIVLAEQEGKKSKKAAELLAAELDEVHERMESLEDELTSAQNEILTLREDKNRAESAKDDVIRRLEHALARHAEELNMASTSFDNQNNALLNLHADLEHLRKEHGRLLPLLANDFLKKLELLRNVEDTLQGIFRQLASLKASDVSSLSTNLANEGKYFPSESNAVSSPEEYVHHFREHLATNERQITDELLSSLAQELEECNGCVEILKNRLEGQSATFNQKATGMLKMVQLAVQEVTNLAESFKAMKLNVTNLEDLAKEKDNEVLTLRRSNAILQEAEAREADKSRVCEELQIQLKHAEFVANNLARERDMDKERISQLEKCMETLQNDYHSLELSVEEFQKQENSIDEMREEIRSLHDALSSKSQEVEVLMQALDEADMQMENLSKKVREQESIIQQKQASLENLESSRGKAVAKLSATVNRLEDLRKLSEGLLAEVESLQVQVESRDTEISRLRQEVTRCTDDILASQENMKKKAAQLQDFEAWLERMVLKCGVSGEILEDTEAIRIAALMVALENWNDATMSDLESFQKDSRNKDALLQDSQNRIHELSSRIDLLEANLHDKQTQIERLQREKTSGLGPSASPEVSEIEEKAQISKRSVPLAHVRGTRKSSNDHLAVNIDVESGQSTSDLEDDDKGHVFKSLTSSRLVPKVTRPITDRIDGIWVTGGRVLMRQPSARLGLIIYWIVLHLWMMATVL